MNFRCLCLNIRLLTKNWDDFCTCVRPILSCIDVIVLVEINIKVEENSLYYLDGFCAEFENRVHKKGGVIAMFIKNNINYERVNIETSAYENLTVKIVSKSKEKVISGICRPPKLNLIEFMEEFGQITNMKRAHNDVVVLGDMNINIRNNTNNVVLNYHEMLALKGMCNIIKGATRVDLNPGTCTLIDHILVNLPKIRTFSAIVENDISDHYSTLYGVSDEKMIFPYTLS